MFIQNFLRKGRKGDVIAVNVAPPPEPGLVISHELLELTRAYDGQDKRDALLDYAHDYMRAHLADTYSYSVFWIYDRPTSSLVPQYKRPEPAGSGIDKKICNVVVKVDGAKIDALLRSMDNQGLAQLLQLAFDAQFPEHESASRPIFPAIASSGKDSRLLIGVLQTVGTATVDALGRSVLEEVAGAMARTVLRIRDANRLDAMEKHVAKRIHAFLPPKSDVIKVAVEVLFELCKAEVCVVFEPSSDRGNSLKATAIKTGEKQQQHAQAALSEFIARPRSRVNKVFQARERKRFLDANIDPDKVDRELLDQIKPLLSQQEIRSCLMVTLHAEERAIAVFVLYNRRATFAGRFLENDERVADLVVSAIRGPVLADELNRAMDIVDTASINLLDPDKKTADKAEPSKEVLDALQNIIPGVLGFAITRTERRAGKLVRVMDAYGGDERVWSQLDANSENALEIGAGNSQQPKNLGNAADPLHVFKCELPKSAIPNYSSPSHELIIGTRYARLSNYERRMIWAFCKEISTTVSVQGMIQMHLGNLIITRHAIRGSLGGVIGHVNTIKRHLKYAEETNSVAQLPKTAAFTKAVDRAGMHANYSAMLLDASRLLFVQDLTAENLRRGFVSVADLVSEAVDMHRSVAAQRGIEFDYQNHILDDHRYSLDRAFIHIAVVNLIDNAIKYSFRNQTIKIDLDGDRSRWRFKIEDTGVYIEHEDREKIFEPFVRSPSGPSARLRHGTGLGLAAVNLIANAHGGAVEVESRLTLAGSREKATQDREAITTFVLSIPTTS